MADITLSKGMGREHLTRLQVQLIHLIAERPGRPVDLWTRSKQKDRHPASTRTTKAICTALRGKGYVSERQSGNALTEIGCMLLTAPGERLIGRMMQGRWIKQRTRLSIPKELRAR